MKQYESLTYENELGGRLEFSIGSVYHTNVSKDVSGLSSFDSTIYETESMGQHGSTEVGVRIETRDVDVHCKVNNPDKAVQLKLRRDALRILNPELKGTLYYNFGSFQRQVGAKVTGKPEFTQEAIFPELNVTFHCSDPFWTHGVESQETIASWIEDWYFPTVIWRDDPDSMIFGHRENNLIVDIYNDGDVSTGMRVVFSALADVENPELFAVNSREYIKINYTMAAGDTITVDTSYGSKSITLKHNGIESNIYRYMDPDSTFMQLAVGDNLFRYNADGGLTNLGVAVYFQQQYLGV